MTTLPRITAQERASVLDALSSALKHVSSLEVDGGVLAQVRSKINCQCSHTLSAERLNVADCTFWGRE